jgi:antitoxin ParD1/3/4
MLATYFGWQQKSAFDFGLARQPRLPNRPSDFEGITDLSQPSFSQQTKCPATRRLALHPRFADCLQTDILPNFAKPTRVVGMATMNIYLPEALKEFVDQQVSTAGYGSSSEYVRELILRDQERMQLRNPLLEGAQSRPTGLADADHFASLRSGIKKQAT